MSRIEVRVLRNGEQEACHQASAVVQSHQDYANGVVAEVIGDPDPGSFLRSAAKPFQTLALFATGVPEKFDLTAEEIASSPEIGAWSEDPEAPDGAEYVENLRIAGR